ncbi:hypothetical protein [Leptospirillum ferriphilum]|uniref:hypothetical protein n=1 Tax=Leptospirillum ferriphilum TaxID=178606 RepID=UPI0006B1647A|nr:hypothetical protein [Leptospirillum ferriphilum]
MKKLSITLDETTYGLIQRQAAESRRRVSQVAIEALMVAFPSDVCQCDRCGKAFSVEADEGSVREEGAFCNKHLPMEEDP